MRPLGPKQIESLFFIGHPGRLLVTPIDETMRSLERRGLVGPWHRNKDGCGTRITPDGMRALADLYERGDLDRFMQTFAPRRKKKAR